MDQEKGTLMHERIKSWWNLWHLLQWNYITQEVYSRTVGMLDSADDEMVRLGITIAEQLYSDNARKYRDEFIQKAEALQK